MRTAEKLADELREWYQSCRTIGAKEYERLKVIWMRGMSGVPHELADDVFAEFLSRCSGGEDPAKALDWLVVISSILLQEYNEEKLPLEDWVQLRDLINNSAGIMDIDALSYIMQLVVDHGAIHS